MNDPFGVTLDILTVREWINGAWFVMSLCATAVFGTFLWREMANAGWYKRRDVRAAIALFIYFLGETIIRGWVWAYLAMTHGVIDRVGVDLTSFAVLVTAASLSMLGALCCIRIFSRDCRAWIVTGLILAAFVVLEVFVLPR